MESDVDRPQSSDQAFGTAAPGTALSRRGDRLGTSQPMTAESNGAGPVANQSNKPTTKERAQRFTVHRRTLLPAVIPPRCTLR